LYIDLRILSRQAQDTNIGKPLKKEGDHFSAGGR
jgi:hypothetical protein